MTTDQIRKLGTIVLLIFVAFLLVYGYQRLRAALANLNMKTATEPGKTTPGKAIAASSACTRGNLFPLTVGSCGSNVTKLQTLLNVRGNYGLQVDGIFGAKTLAAVKSAFNTSSVTQQAFSRMQSSQSSSDNSGTWSDGQSTPSTGGNTSPDYFGDDVPNTSISSFATAIKTDLDSTYLFGGRKSEGIWAQLIAVSDNDLAAIAKYIKDTYNESLFQLITSAKWSVSDNGNLLIKNRLTAVGYGK